jgi:transcriptional regulator with XRE-family HTH domain
VTKRFKSESLPNRIREIRESKGLVLADVAERGRLSIAQVGDLERGDRQLTLRWMRVLAQVLEVTPVELLKLDDNPNLLSTEERLLIQKFRCAGPNEKAKIAKIIDILVMLPTDINSLQLQDATGQIQ